MFVDYGDKTTVKLNNLQKATGFGEIPMLAHRFYVPQLRAYQRNKEWSDHALQKCREWLVNETCNMHIKDLNISAKGKIAPCTIVQAVKRTSLVEFIKMNHLYYEEEIDEEELILFV